MKLWGGRFEKETDKTVESFHSSIRFDSRLARQDIIGSIAHANMLGASGIIREDEAKEICDGLRGILQDIEDGKVEFSQHAEDIHMNIEALLTQRIGSAGKKLHTARSRNDQVALDMRMYIIAACAKLNGRLSALMETLLSIAEQHTGTYMPGYTHLQKAQPITLAHHMMAYFEMFMRDAGRFIDTAKRADSMPLGSGALAGTTYPVERQMVADELGFSNISANSLDAVSDRDFVIECVSACSLCMMHLSRFCEEIILWATGEFAFIELDDGYSTGSSIMPQKKNPDVAELIRGKTGRVYGSLTGLLCVMKGLPLAYNKDMQEDKEMAFDAIDTLSGCLEVFTGMLATTRFLVDNMAAKALDGFTNATDAADYLAAKGMPFRDAHEVAGRMVLHCIQRSIPLLSLSLDEFKAFSPMFDADIYDALSLEACVKRRNVEGGPSPDAVEKAIAKGRNRLEAVINASNIL
ncbi:MAG: argininosuccinate lyase [Christensenellales bacterium]|jgi:argininosuccinate lyase